MSVTPISPGYIQTLDVGSGLGYADIFYGPRRIDPNSANDNSTIRLFRKGSFNVLSLGDVESPNISTYLSRRRILSRETDVMVLAHHGADNGFTTKGLVRSIDPSVALCSCDYSNMYDHPRQEIRDILHEMEVILYTTKTGDVLLTSTGTHIGDFMVTNFKEGSASISSQRNFVARKKKLLAMNRDSLRNLYRPRPHYLR